MPTLSIRLSATGPIYLVICHLELTRGLLLVRMMAEGRTEATAEIQGGVSRPVHR
jgi:hypothetical protein